MEDELDDDGGRILPDQDLNFVPGSSSGANRRKAGDIEHASEANKNSRRARSVIRLMTYNTR